ncbi:MAG: phage tail protein [Treponema sp.]|nr:phage tail protein [Treponema sp.]
MLLGSWGPLVFDVSGIGALTFSELTQDVSGRWAVHEVVNTAPITEFLGPGQDEAEMRIILSKMLGVNPEAEYELLRQMVRTGQNFPVILRGFPLSGNNWYLDSISGASSKFAAGTGEVLWMELTVNFKEYN